MMTQPMLTQTRLHAGLWEAVLEHPSQTPPQLTATHDGQLLPDLRCAPGPRDGTWRISLPIPAHVLTDGLQTVVLCQADGTCVGSLAILAGAPLGHDLRAEINLLRSELDLLKSAFRRTYIEN